MYVDDPVTCETLGQVFPIAAHKSILVICSCFVIIINTLRCCPISDWRCSLLYMYCKLSTILEDRRITWHHFLSSYIYKIWEAIICLSVLKDYWTDAASWLPLHIKDKHLVFQTSSSHCGWTVFVLEVTDSLFKIQRLKKVKWPKKKSSFFSWHLIKPIPTT